MKLGLGTAQFDERGYGIAREAEPPGDRRIEAILRVAETRGVDLLDTAPAYGAAESLLGRLSPAGSFRIVTKTRVFRRPIVAADRVVVRDDFRRSQDRLRRDRLDGLLVHHADDLLDGGGGHIFEALTSLKEQGQVSGIGVSVYDGGQLERILDRFPVDLVQGPLNLLDQRLARDGWLDAIRRRGIEIHLRSVFLQGLLLMDPQRLPARVAPVRAHLLRCEAATRRRGLTRLQAALAYVAGQVADGVVLCGADSPAQLEEICDGAEHSARLADADWSEYRLDDPRWIDPRRWQEQEA